MRFEKWEACGNDFIIVEEELSGERVKELCDRHYGIGADGVLEVLRRSGVEGVMVVKNADGSEAEMCGNGIRCVAGYLAKRGPRSEYKISTKAGEKVVTAERGEYAVRMGRARVEWEREIEAKVGRSAKRYEAVHVEIGNPHCVLIVSEEETKRGEVERYGRSIERDAELFPRGTNVEYVTVINEEELRVRVWERGSGRTLACGTGACASAYAAHKKGLIKAEVKVKLDGGEVKVKIGPEGEIELKGPARRVYAGEI